MKKVVNSVLASALALSVAPMAFAADEATTTTTAPAMDAELEKVVKRLEALGLVAGYGNGDYGVDRTITRAEFATLIVRMRALEQGAQMSQYQSIFTDVNSSDWFSGFVNVAAGQEIVKGFPDKTFKPQNQVTYAESVAMIIRALGHEPAVKGEWPNNYIAKASELNIAKNITTPNVAATRGDVFKMIDNALRVDLMEQIEYGTDIRYQLTNETLLTRYLDVIVRDMEWASDTNNRDASDLPVVSNVPVVGLGTLKANEVTLSGRNADLGTNATYKVTDGINPNDFAGQHVQVWIKDDVENTIVWMEASTEEEVIMDRIDTFDFDGKDMKGDPTELDDIKDLDDLEIVLDGNGKSYSFTEDTKVTYNFNPADKEKDTLDALKDVIEAGLPYAVKLVLDDSNEVSYIHIIDDVSMSKDEKEVKYGSKVIEEIDADDKRIKNLDGKSFTELDDLEEGEDFLVFLNNEPATLADLQKMDVYNVYYADGQDDKLLVFATRNVVEGEVEKVTVRSNTDNRLVVNGETYRTRTSEDGGTTYSDDANDDITEITADNQDLLRDLDGEEVKLYLDASGRIRHIETKDDLTDRKFKAIVTRAAVYDGGEYSFTVLSEKGTRTRINIDADDIEDVNGDEYNEDLIEEDFVPNKDNPMLLEVTLNADGDATKVEVLGTATESMSGDVWENAADEDEELLNVGGTYYEVTSDTAIFDMTGEIEGSKRPELDDARTLDWEDIAEEEDLTVFYTLDEEDREVEAVFVVEGDSVSGDYMYGYFLQSDSDDQITLLTQKDGTVQEVTYKLDDDYDNLDDEIKRGDVIAFQLNNSDELIVDDVIDVVSEADDFEGFSVLGEDDWANADIEFIAVGKVVDADDNRVEIATTADESETATYFVNDATAYINAYDEEEGDELNEGDFVVLIKDNSDGDRIDYAIYLANEDEVEEDNLDEDNFWAQVPGNDDDPTVPPTGEPGDLIESVSATEKEQLPGMISIYTVTGKVAAGAEVTVTVGGRDPEDFDIDEDGNFTATVYGAPGATVAKVTVTLDDEEESVDVDIEKE